MTTEVSNNLRCFWCNHPMDNCPGHVKNGIQFCWVSGCGIPGNICEHIRRKMDTMVDNYECPVCMETKKALEMPRCSHKVCLDCYKTIYFGVSEFEKPCEYRDLISKINYPIPDQEEDEIQSKHHTFFVEKMNYEYEDDVRPYDELITLRDSLMCDRPEWMNIQEIINYENELFKITSDYRIKEDNYLASRTIGNQSCPICRARIEY